MTRIDVGSVLRNSANLPFSDLVTRPTGAAVRRCIQSELAALSEGDVALLDFSQIGMMDYSCADEVVAKLLIALAGQDAHAGYIVFHGITDAHLEAIEVVLDQAQFLRDESLPVKVRISNRSGQTLKLGQDPDWLSFNIQRLDGSCIFRYLIRNHYPDFIGTLS